jgi:hypothetical protein
LDFIRARTSFSDAETIILKLHLQESIYCIHRISRNTKHRFLMIWTLKSYTSALLIHIPYIKPTYHAFQIYLRSLLNCKIQTTHLL